MMKKIITLAFILLANMAYASNSGITLDVINSPTSGSKLVFQIPMGWKMYAEKQGDIGLPLQFDFSESKNLADAKVVLPKPLELTEKIAGKEILTIYYASGKLESALLIKAKDKELPVNLVIKVTLGACNKVCVSDQIKISSIIYPNNIAAANQSLIIMVLLAIVGGLILNIMPCVLPVLSLKVLNMVRYGSYGQQSIIFNLLATAAGIIFSFMVLAGFTIIIKDSGEAFGWGFHFQNSGFIMFLTLILVVFSSNLWGDFEINLPEKIMNKISNPLGVGVNNSFLSGMFATMLATPCTVPFISTSVAYAVSQGTLEILVIYAALGVGMSLPYLVASLFPNSISLLPKPGAWMVSLKKFLALMLLCTAFWLIYVLTGQLALRSVLFFVGSLLIIKLLLTHNLTSYIKFPGAILVAIIGFNIPFVISSEIEKEDKIIDSSWEEFNESKLEDYILDGQVVLLDITADWCITCKVNKILVLNNVKLLNLLKSENVILMRGDITENSSAISKNIIGYLERNQRYGIPYNVLFGPKNPKGIILPTLLSRAAIIDAYQKVK